MARNDLFKRSIDAGITFTALTQSRAEALVKELVKAGELQADQTREAVHELLERSRKNSERLLELIAQEVRSQITSLGLASQADLDRIERRMAGLLGGGERSVRTPAKRAAPAAAPTGPAQKKPAPAKQAPAKQPAAKKQAPAKKAAAKKQAPAKKAAAKKQAPVKKGPVKKAPVKKAATKAAPPAAGPPPVVPGEPIDEA